MKIILKKCMAELYLLFHTFFNENNNDDEADDDDDDNKEMIMTVG